MRLDVSKALAAEGNEIPFDLEVCLREFAMFGDVIRFPYPARLIGTYASVGETVSVSAELSFVAQARCSLCLKPMEKSYSVPVEAKYALSPNPENPDLYVYNGAWIDPADMAADAASLALPIQWRCAETCKGLCAVCGADLNLTSCECRIETNTSPFAALTLPKDKNEV